MRCIPEWRCRKFGCYRCDADRKREAERKAASQQLDDLIRGRRRLPSRPPDDPRLN